MKEYYAVVRSTDHLAHYGVKGMKWGVRKAIQSGNTKRLSRQYNRAMRKLARLNRKADIKTQTALSKKQNTKSKVALGVSAAGAGALMGNRLIAKGLMAKNAMKPAQQTFTRMNSASEAANIAQSASKKKIVGQGKPIYITGEGLGTGPVGTGANGLQPKNKGVNGFKAIRDAAAVTTAAGLGLAAYHKGRSLAAKYRTTAKGHAKAVAKRDAWKREMQSAFKGVNTSALNKKKRTTKRYSR